jgi:hypothetical protein
MAGGKAMEGRDTEARPEAMPGARPGARPGTPTRSKEMFALVAGILYVVMGLLEVVTGLGLGGRWSEVLLLGGGAPDGLALLLVGAVFVQGNRELSRGLTEGVAFVYMGIVLALFFSVLDLAEIGASYVGALLIGGDYAGYSALLSVTPALYLAPLALLGLWQWRGGFTLIPFGNARPEVKVLNKTEEG